MPRTKGAAVELIDGQVDEAAVRTALDAATSEGQRRALIVEQFNGGMTFDKQALITEHNAHAATMGETALRMGQIYIVLKEHLPHGEFMQTLERDLGVDPRLARRLMQAAAKFAGGSRKLLASRVERTKLLALMSEDDDELDLLAEGGTLAGHNLDELERMTVRELRDALRREREDHASALKRKEETLNRLERDLIAAERKPSTWQQAIFQTSIEIAKARLEITNAAKKLRHLSDEVQQLPLAGHPQEATDALGENLYWNAMCVTADVAEAMQEIETLWRHYAERARPILEQMDIYGDAQLRIAKEELENFSAGLADGDQEISGA